jgi:cyclase
VLKKRLIPVLFLKNGLIVRSEGFEDFREMGNPVNQLERLNDWCADELIYVDITREGEHDLKRDDQKFRMDHSSIVEILGEISKKSFMPLTFGGRIRSLDDAAALIANGADKVIVNTAAHLDPGLVTGIARQFGSQCVVVGVDVLRQEGVHRVKIRQGSEWIEGRPEDLARRAEDAGAGEIFLNSIDRDGASTGYDLEIIDRVARAVRVPLIACGGAGSFEDFEEVMTRTAASAVAAGNIFNFTENAYRRAKVHLEKQGLPVRRWVPKQV